LVLTERNTYGSSRVGLEQVGLEMEYVEYNPQLPLPSPYFVSDEIGDKRYQLSNHLGNVLEVVTDRKLPEDDGTYYENDIFISTTLDNKVDYYTADVVSYSDYYPYGMVMPNRNASASDYRYGFNGMEMDDEVKGNGNSYDFGARMYDSRVGRWFAIDPLTANFPSHTPYNFGANNPIYYIDSDGNEYTHPYTGLIDEQQKVVDEKQIKYDKLIKSYTNAKGKISKRNEKKANNDSGLKNAESKLASLENKKSIVEGYLKTFEKVSPEEYSYFKELKQADGEDVMIEISLIDGEADTRRLYGETSYEYMNLTYELDKEGDKIYNGVLLTNFEGTDADFKIKLYGRVYEGVEASYNSDYQAETTDVFGTGWKYGILMNELGDIKYIFEEISTPEDLILWKNSNGGDDPLYRSDTEGAGHYSREYQKTRVQEKKE
jgi:RHS repeat-associated protein